MKTTSLNKTKKKASLSAQKIVKRYEGVKALSDGNLDIRSGEVVALFGANGSGKSTLGKIITGAVIPDGGKLLLDNKEVHFSSPQAANLQGITAVYQELSLIPELTIGENIWLTHEPLTATGQINTKEVRARTVELLNLFKGMFQNPLRADVPVKMLQPDERQVVEILKALSHDPRVLILDEATASLDSRQVNHLFELIADWKEEGMAIVFISHIMDEIFRVADRVTVLRNGISVGHKAIADTNEQELVNLMIGDVAEVRSSVDEQKTPKDFKEAEVFLKVRDLRTGTLNDVSFDVYKSEVLGIGGLRGQGQRDLLLSIFGAIPYSGQLILSGEKVSFRHPSQAMKKGIALIPGDRATEGLLMIRSVFENLQLPSWRKYGMLLRMSKAVQDANKIAEDLNLVMSGLEAPANSLSGGNAQKIVIGKWLLRNPRLLLLDDPTKGVDVGTKAEFYMLLSRLSGEDTTVLFYSSDDEELLELCDRVLVFQNGEVRTELIGEKLTSANLVEASIGVSKKGDSSP